MTAVVFVRLSAMGDLVQGLGAVAALHEVRPTWRLTIATQTTNAPLLDGFPGVARVIPFARHGRLGGVVAAWRALRAEQYDYAVDLQGNWKSAWFTRLAPARVRVGIGPESRQEPASRWLLQRTVSAPGVRHPALVAWHLVRTLAPEVPFRLPRLLPRPAEVDTERQALQRLGIDCTRPFQVIVVTDPQDARALRPEWIDRWTRNSPQPVLHLLGPAERGVPARPGVATMRHEPGQVRRLLALGALVRTAAGDVLGPDQGAVHVLQAAGARCRVLFGSQDPLLTGPPGATLLVHPAPPSCSPCRRRRCDHAGGAVCMEFEPAQAREVRVPRPE